MPSLSFHSDTDEQHCPACMLSGQCGLNGYTFKCFIAMLTWPKHSNDTSPRVALYQSLWRCSISGDNAGHSGTHYGAAADIEDSGVRPNVSFKAAPWIRSALRILLTFSNTPAHRETEVI